MRIISGSARGRQLAAFSGKNIRPTSDRVREAVFSILQSRFGSFDGSTVLDLFCGSGALSLEAISRGAQSAILIDSGRDSGQTACENIKRCHFEDAVTFYRQDVYSTLPRLAGSAPFDLIFLDPPYNMGHLQRALEAIDSLNLLSKSGIICAESAKGEQVEALSSLRLFDTRSYGSTQIHLLGHPED